MVAAFEMKLENEKRGAEGEKFWKKKIAITFFAL